MKKTRKSISTKPGAPVELMDALITFPSGAKRSADTADVRFDLICPEGLFRLARRCAVGSRKYGDLNWTRGLPIQDLLNHTLNHLNLWMKGDTADDHIAAATWGLFAIMHQEACCRHPLKHIDQEIITQQYLNAVGNEVASLTKGDSCLTTT